MAEASYRKPHPLFDPNFYLENYPDIAEAGFDPLVHFLKYGGLEGRHPHPDFDSAFYLATNPEVLAKGINPLVHFLNEGAARGRLPHAEFDKNFYVLANPGMADSGLDPVLHFATIGAARGYVTRAQRETLSPIECFLPAINYQRPPIPDREVDVIIPVYRGLAETRRCIESVLSSACQLRLRIVVIDDCSPEPALSAYLQQLAQQGKIHLIRNDENQGFVASVNAGMKASENDIVLLNSDTEVFGDWLDRLWVCAHADPRVGTVTPFSNNATICSYPAFCTDNKLPDWLALGALDGAFATVNAGRSMQIPTAIGFCMFVRRECLREVGLFDVEAFGAGYGEENDFCMRATELGWTHRLACDVFVHHTGSVSFDSVNARQKKATETLVARYPLYPILVRKHVQADTARAFRFAVTANRMRNSGKRVFLSVSHALGGGVAQHLRDLMQVTAGDVIWLNLMPSSRGRVDLECAVEGYEFSLRVDLHAEYEFLLAIIKACGVERIHLHHFLGYGPEIHRLTADLGLPFDFTVHDYFTICPQIYLSDEQGRYCGEPDQDGCDRCLIKRPLGGGVMDILSWRSKYRWALAGAERVIAPSADVADRIRRYCLEARIVAAEHPGPDLSAAVVPRGLGASEPLKVAVLGTMATHKGFKLLQECAEAAKRSSLPVEFTLIGNVAHSLTSRPEAFTETGKYKEAELPELLNRVAPHVVWFPGQCVETFSYALSTCLELGWPVAVHDLGAFPERVAARPWSWVAPRDGNAKQWIDLFLQIRKEHFVAGAEPLPPPARKRAATSFYQVDYLKNGTGGGERRSTTESRASEPLKIVAAAATDENGQLQTCGYIRVVQPLSHPAVADQVQLTLVDPQHVDTSDTDAVLIQRVVVPDLHTADRIIKTCRERGVQLIYEIDDGLFDISVEHAEYEAYAQLLPAAKLLARSADAIVTSTVPLRDRMIEFNKRVFVLPNYIDDILWGRPPSPPTFGNGPIRIVYVGTISHRDDLRLLGRAVEAMGDLRQQIHVDVIGLYDAELAARPYFRFIPVPNAIAPSLPRFVKWMREQNRWHWGVAPLLDTPFNRLKSPLKCLEYAAMGLPSICSGRSVYDAVIRREETGVLVENDVESWRQALIAAVTDSERWARLRQACESLARENSLSFRASEISAAWRTLITDANLHGVRS